MSQTGREEQLHNFMAHVFLLHGLFIHDFQSQREVDLQLGSSFLFNRGGHLRSTIDYACQMEGDLNRRCWCAPCVAHVPD